MNVQEMEKEDLLRREMRANRRNLRLKRKKQKKMITGFAILFIVSLFVFPFGAIKSNANNGYKYYTDIIVQPGESLWEIASRYTDYDHYRDMNSYISEVRHINHIDDDSHIIAGQMLIIPYYSEEYIY